MKIRWNKLILEEFIKESCLSEELEQTLRLHVSGWGRVKIAEFMSVSVPTVDRWIAELKKRYDDVALYDPILPPRKQYHHQIKDTKK